MVKRFVAFLFVITPLSFFGMDTDGDEQVRKLWVACKDGDTKQAAYSLDAGVNPKTRLLCGAPLNSTEHNNSTFLHSAARGGHTAIMALLLDHGADIDAKNLFGNSPLMDAVLAQHLSAVDLLIDRGANVNIRNNFYKHTPLMVAAKLFNREAVERLLKARAQVNVVARQDGNALNCLSDQLVLCASAHTLNTLKEDQALAIIELLKQHDVVMCAQDENGKTPLHRLAFIDNRRCIARLLLPLKSDTFKKEALERCKTFLLVNKRHETTQSIPALPLEVVLRILAHMPIDCVYGGLKDKIVPFYKDDATLRRDFLDAGWPHIRSLVPKEKVLAIHDILNLQDDDGQKAANYATDPEIEHLLDPKTWK